jgi:hypothetical protein
MQAYDSKGRFLNRGIFHGVLRKRLGGAAERSGRGEARAGRTHANDEHTVWIIDDDGRCWRLLAAEGECQEIGADELPDPVRRFLA